MECRAEVRQEAVREERGCTGEARVRRSRRERWRDGTAGGGRRGVESPGTRGETQSTSVNKEDSLSPSYKPPPLPPPPVFKSNNVIPREGRKGIDEQEEERQEREGGRRAAVRRLPCPLPPSPPVQGDEWTGELERTGGRGTMHRPAV